jgi:hypothetical protein
MDNSPLCGSGLKKLTHDDYVVDRMVAQEPGLIEKGIL